MRALYEFAAGDRPVVRSIASVTTETRVDIGVRYDNGKDDLNSFDVTTAGTRAVELFREGGDDKFEFPGRVTSLAFDALGVTKRGQYYTHAFLERGDVSKLLSLGAFYVTSEFFGGLGYFENNLSGKGFMRDVDIGDPAADVEYTTQAVPGGARWKVRGFGGTLVADANAANRMFEIIYTDGTDTFARGITTTRQTASQTIKYGGLIGGGNPRTDAAPIDAASTPVLLPDVELNAGDEVSFNTVARQVGDNWGQGMLKVEEWLEE